MVIRKRALVLAAGCGIGALLWWLFFRSGIAHSILLVGVVFLVALLFPNVKLPINNRLAWGGSMALAILVALLLGPRFGVPPLAGVGIAVFTFLVILAAMKLKLRELTDEEFEEQQRELHEWMERNQQLEDERNSGRHWNGD